MNLGIIGIGLIGGSIAKELMENELINQTIGYDLNSEHADRALELGIVNKVLPLEELCLQADLIIISVPVDKAPQILNFVLDRISSKQIVTDVGSTKSAICQLAEKHPKGSRFVPGHPIAGTENSGPEAAQLNLFKDKKGILCPTDNVDPEALETIWEMYSELGMTIEMMDYHDHDKHIAYVSHLSHISSFALGLTVLDIEENEKNIFNLAGSGFSSTVRLAKSSPAMWTPILKENSEFLLNALSEYIEQLNKFKNYIIQDDTERLFNEMKKANGIRRILDGNLIAVEK